ncbi:MAG: ATP-binding protein [Candidatus Aenigmarchaeota archaeon]|nr:ATP-binding protein [Candidatus Aenigmarchaeota archaeon]
MPLEEIIVGREPAEIVKYGKKGCGFLGKHVVGTGLESYLTNPVLIDLMKPHVMLIVGKRGTGKSYSGAVIAEEIMNLPENMRKNLCALMIDTMGIYWSMKEANDEALLLLKEWKMKPKGFEIEFVIPSGLKEMYDRADIKYSGMFSVQPHALSVGDWLLVFGIELNEPLGILLERAVRKLGEKKYNIRDIINEVEKDERSGDKEKMGLVNRFMAAESWGIFSDTALSIEKFLKPGVATVIDVSLMEWSVRNLMVGILAREVYEVRTKARREEELAKIAGEEKRKVPLTWFIMDEAHNFVPSLGKTAATDSLLRLVTEGRQPGISTVFITQRPNKLNETVIAQADLVLAHRLTAKPDLDALSAIMQTYALENIVKSISKLPRTKGAGLILDDNSERIFNVQVRPRESWHAGGTAMAIEGKE